MACGAFGAGLQATAPDPVKLKLQICCSMKIIKSEDTSTLF
jgi:hypothetical protein